MLSFEAIFFNPLCMKCRAYLAELIATFTLTLMVSLAVISQSQITPMLAALVVGTFIYTIGAISGAHINPAVTIGLASVKKINFKDAAFYIVAQFFGAVLAMFMVKYMTGASVVAPEAVDSLKVGIGEMLGAFILVFGVSSVAQGKNQEGAAGITIGSSLLIGIILASGAGAAGILNPAVAVGIGSVSFMYIIAPIVGGILAAWVYKYLAKK